MASAAAHIGDAISLRDARRAMEAARREAPAAESAGAAARGPRSKRLWRPDLMRNVVGSVQEGESGDGGAAATGPRRV